MKKIQISERLFILLVQYHLYDIGMEQNKTEIKTLIEEKYEAVTNRNLYSKYKTALIEDEREKARIEYLNNKGYYKDFRW